MYKQKPRRHWGAVVLNVALAASSQTASGAWNEFPYGTNTASDTNLCDQSSYPCVEGDAFAAEPPEAKETLTVLSYNLLRARGERLQNIIRWISDEFGPEGPDVMLLSETVRGGDCSVVNDTTREIARAFGAYSPARPGATGD